MTDHGQNMSEAGVCSRGLDIAPYLQGQMSPNELTLFEGHLKTCASCQTRVVAFRKVITQLKQIPTEAPIRDMAPDIIARIPEREWSRSSPSGGFMLFLRLAALFLCVAGVGLLAVHMRSARQSGIAATAIAQEWKHAQVAPAKNDGQETGEKTQAVATALEWLASTQETDGNWDAEKWGAEQQYTVGITALSLLAFIDSDRHALDGPNAATVSRGLNYLMTRQSEQGRFGPECKEQMYNHGIATLALLEAYALKKDDAFKQAIGRAIQFTCKQQNGADSWGYEQSAVRSLNTSVTVWPLQALIRADSLGFPGLKPVIKRSIFWLKTMTSPDGEVAYSKPGEFPDGYDALTAAGVVCLVKSQGRVSGGDTEKMLAVLHKSADEQGESINYYSWYFLTQALQGEGGEQSDKLVTRLQRTLLAKQTRSGPCPGSWDLSDQWSASGGRVYTTAMSVLSLQ
jgi:hypothetical protein